MKLGNFCKTQPYLSFGLQLSVHVDGYQSKLHLICFQSVKGSSLPPIINMNMNNMNMNDILIYILILSH